MGDPANLAFTDMVRQRFGWKGDEGRFDHLPLVCQVDPDKAPELFDIPQTYITDVDIWHPQHPSIAGLGRAVQA